MTAPAGTARDPLHLRPGETDRFYFLFGPRFLAEGDTLTGTPTVVSPGVTIAGVARNSTPLTYEGVEHAIDTVVYCDVSGIAQGEKVEIVCTATTTSGRIAVNSLWVEGVRAHS